MKRSLLALFLVVVVAVLAGCSHQEKPNSDAETDYSTIFQQATDSDGATAESIADELAKAYDENPKGLLSAMGGCTSEQMQTVAQLLVYGKSYTDLEAFTQDVKQRLEEDNPVLSVILQVVDSYNAANTGEQHSSNLPADTSQFDVEKLREFVVNHNYDSGADEEFFSLLANVYRQEPETLIKVVKGLSDNQLDYIAKGIAYDILNNGNYKPDPSLNHDNEFVARIETAIADDNNKSLSAFDS